MMQFREDIPKLNSNRAQTMQTLPSQRPLPAPWTITTETPSWLSLLLFRLPRALSELSFNHPNFKSCEDNCSGYDDSIDHRICLVVNYSSLSPVLFQVMIYAQIHKMPRGIGITVTAVGHRCGRDRRVTRRFSETHAYDVD